MDEESVTMEALQQLTEAQALIVNVPSKLCNSFDKTCFGDQLMRYKELHKVQKSIMSLTWDSIQDMELKKGGKPARDELEHNQQPETLSLKRKHISIDGDHQLMSTSKNQRLSYDKTRFTKHMSELELYFKSIHVRSDYDSNQDGLVVAIPKSPLKQMTKRLLKGDMECIENLIYVQRNPVYQLYMMPGFHYASHWSEERKGWLDLESCFPSSKAEMFQNHVPMQSLSNGGIILNHTRKAEDPVALSLAQSLKDICHSIFPYFDLKTAKGRKIPSIGFGYTDNNPNEYKKNKVFPMGKMKRPNLMTVCHKGIDDEVMAKVALLAAGVIVKLSPDTVGSKGRGSKPYNDAFF